MEEKTDLQRKKKNLTMWTKYLLDFMLYAGIAVTVTLPFSIKKIGELLPYMVEHYEETVIIYFVLGIAALVLIRELRRIFRTVLKEDWRASGRWGTGASSSRGYRWCAASST